MQFDLTRAVTSSSGSPCDVTVSHGLYSNQPSSRPCFCAHTRLLCSMATPLGNRAMFSYMVILVPLLFLEWTPRTVAQSPISTDMPVPPLQWLNLTASTTNDIHSPPPPLMYSSMGYDPASQSLIIFGGESQAGIPQQNTYLLNLQSLTWSTPSTLVPAHSGSPPARSRALGTGDFAANRFV